MNTATATSHSSPSRRLRKKNSQKHKWCWSLCIPPIPSLSPSLSAQPLFPSYPAKRLSGLRARTPGVDLPSCGCLHPLSGPSRPPQPSFLHLSPSHSPPATRAALASAASCSFSTWAATFIPHLAGCRRLSQAEPSDNREVPPVESSTRVYDKFLLIVLTERKENLLSTLLSFSFFLSVCGCIVCMHVSPNVREVL